MVDNMLAGLEILLHWQSLLGIVIGVNIGIVMGAIPGLTSSMAIAMIIPMTFTMPPHIAITMLMGIYKGGMFGGSIPAILLNTPGIPASAPTALDGYALTKQGKGLKALKVALYASFFGDLFSDLCLLFLAAPLAILAIKCAPPDYAAIIVFSLTIIAGVSGQSIMKGLAAASLGMLLATIGLDPFQGTPRLNFGFIELSGGLSLLPMLIGLLALSELFGQIGGILRNQAQAKPVELPPMDPEKNRLTWADFRSVFKPALRSSVLGTIIGALPGLGPSTASFLAYSEAKRLSKHPEKFGKGAIEGIVASEASNNAVCGANLIPLLTLGIPGDVMAAMLIGALMIHGLRPGPLLITEQPGLMYAIMLGLIACDLTYRFFGTLYIRLAVKTMNIPKKYILPVVFALCTVGSYGVSNNIFDVLVMYFFGLLGWGLNHYGFSLPALLIGFILEPLLENAYRQTILLYGWDFSVFITRPVSLVVLLLTLFSLVSSIRRQRRRSAHETVTQPQP